MANPGIQLGVPNLISFPVCHVYFFVGGGSKSTVKLEGVHGPQVPPLRPVRQQNHTNPHVAAYWPFTNNSSILCRSPVTDSITDKNIRVKFQEHQINVQKFISVRNQFPAQVRNCKQYKTRASLFTVPHSHFF